MKEVTLQRLLTVWFQLWDIVGKLCEVNSDESRWDPGDDLLMEPDELSKLNQDWLQLTPEHLHKKKSCY